MQVTINGVATRLADAITVTALLHLLDLTGRLAVEVNQRIVPRSEFDSIQLQEGDKIEIVHAIGGGQIT